MRKLSLRSGEIKLHCKRLREMMPGDDGWRVERNINRQMCELFVQTKISVNVGGE